MREIDSHRAVSFGDTIYMHGGYANENNLIRNIYKITSNVEGRHQDYVVDVEEIKLSNCPSPRYNHGMVILNGAIWIFGGILQQGIRSNELWRFDISGSKWELVIT